MRKLFSVLSLFAICLCLSCFGVKQAGAFSNEALFTQDIKVKYGGVAVARSGLPYGVAIIKETNGTGFIQAAAQCGNACHSQDLEGVIDASRRLKDGDGTMYHGSGDPDFKRVDPEWPELMVVHNSGNDGSKAHTSG